MSWLALDIGGANLKISDGQAYAEARPFALWRYPERLADALAELLVAAPPDAQVAVTMTGELADCYATRKEGVEAILTAVGQAVDGRPVSVYQTDGQLLPVDDPRCDVRLIAASNWHALAVYACRWAERLPSLLVDVGSTTVDLIPIDGGRVVARGATDIERLIHGELIYTGVERSPVCAIAPTLPYRGHDVPVAQEVFATTLDAYLVLGATAEDRANGETADGRPRTIDAARRRLGRAICTELSAEEARCVAEAVVEGQVQLVARAWQKAVAALGQPVERIVVTGHGDDLVGRTLAKLGVDCEIVPLGDQLGVAASRAAPAFALANLARERFGA